MMNYSGDMQKRIKWGLLFAAFFALTPIMFVYADIERGYNATGGEVFIPLVPFLIYSICNTKAKEAEGEDEDVKQ